MTRRLADEDAGEGEGEGEADEDGRGGGGGSVLDAWSEAERRTARLSPSSVRPSEAARLPRLPPSPSPPTWPSTLARRRSALSLPTGHGGANPALRA